jgi:hypothetical protein
MWVKETLTLSLVLDGEAEMRRWVVSGERTCQALLLIYS